MTHIDANGHATQSNLGEPASGTEKSCKGDYKIGRGRPPLHSQFKPGQSGNPSGRRKGSRNLKTELKEIMSKMITIREGETERKLSCQQQTFLSMESKVPKEMLVQQRYF
jgi:hypothetical protein